MPHHKMLNRGRMTHSTASRQSCRLQKAIRREVKVWSAAARSAMHFRIAGHSIMMLEEFFDRRTEDGALKTWNVFEQQLAKARATGLDGK